MSLNFDRIFYLSSLIVKLNLQNRDEALWLFYLQPETCVANLTLTDAITKMHIYNCQSKTYSKYHKIKIKKQIAFYYQRLDFILVPLLI